MKSYCIKTDNKEIIEYLLNKISKIDIPNIYYCNKSFKIYENVILHYTDNNVEQFNNLVAELITEVIIKFSQIKILKRIINVNYFYFDEFERKIILENCDEFIKQEEEKITETIFISVKEYILEHKSIVVEGVANFRINEYIKALDNIVANTPLTKALARVFNTHADYKKILSLAYFIILNQNNNVTLP